MQIDTVLVLELVCQELDQPEVKSPPEGVTVIASTRAVATVDFCDFNIEISNVPPPKS